MSVFKTKITEDYYQPTRGNDGFSGNCIEYEGSRNKNKALLIKDYLEQIRPYLKDNIINPFKSLRYGKFNQQ